MSEPTVIPRIVMRAALEVAERWLAANREAVNAINVYPVPDGDTGTNMLLTWRAALQAAGSNPEAPSGEYLEALARGALLGARGNSGVILSQMLAGFARGSDRTREFDGAMVAHALSTASEIAYAAVSQPVEGTMLTVLRDAAAAARDASERGATEALHAAVAEAHASVQRTPALLPRLRDAGVVDAGGLGVAILLEGLLYGVTGDPLPEVSDRTADGVVMLDAVEHEGYGYCTEFVVLNRDPETELNRAGIEAALVAAGGESILVVGDGATAHVHVHMEDPGPALSIGAARGALASVKVEDMQAQHESWMAEHEGDHPGPSEAPVNLPAIGLVAVARGAGIAAAFRDLGATQVLESGSQKVSAGELIEAARAAGREHAVLLPNDRDVLMAAEQAATEATGFVTVVPTRTLAAGLAAAVAYLPHGDPAEVAAAMAEAAEGVRCVEVSKAVRDATVDGVAVREGEAIALVDGRLVAAHATTEQALVAGLEAADAAGAELLTIYLGEGVTVEAGERTAAAVAARFPQAEVETVPGGQPHYAYLVGVE